MNELQESLGMSKDILVPLLVLVIIIAFIAVVAQWALYAKANQPGWACLVPIYNIVVFLKIVGRPASHFFLFLIPIFNIYFIIKIYVELCNAFGKHSTMDYVLCIVFNGFYVFYLGLTQSIEYQGPVYNQTNNEKPKAAAV